MQLKLYIRQTAVFNKTGTQIYYNGLNPQSLTSVAGNLPSARQFPKYPAYIDVSSSVSDLYKLKLTWTAERDQYGEIIPGVSQTKKSATSILTFEGEAYVYLKKWLIDDVSAPLNSVDVQIDHVGVGSYTDYVIKASDLTWCDSENICIFDTTIKQKEEALTCIKRTLITDNHLGWFQEGGGSIKKHPRFSYCNEQRPNGVMIMIWFLTGIVVVPTLLVIIPILFVLNVIFAIINIIIGVIKWIISVIGGNDVDEVDWSTIPYFNFNAIMDSLGAYYVESAGCGREHPSVLIRDYIGNVCAKCGVRVDAQTAPLFFSDQYEFIKSTGENVTKYNHFVNACYMYPVGRKGIRRFSTLNALGSTPNTTDYFLPTNAPVMALDQFLDHICPVFNHEWKLEGNALYIQRKDYYTQVTNIQAYDFRKGAADRSKLVDGICYDWNEQKYPAYISGLYATDAGDKPGNEAQHQMNSFIEFGNSDDNPNFDSHIDKTQQFGATKFRLDGASTDYLYDAFQIVVNGSFLTPFLAGLMFDFVRPQIEEYADYALLLESETTSLPKILIWDGASWENAKAVKSHSGYPVVGYTEPEINHKYNTNGTAWNNAHSPETKVRGAGLTLPPNQPGYYVITDFFGARQIRKPALLINYPMYFESNYQNNVWDYFHWIDDPRLFPLMHQNWELKIQLCVDDLKKLKVFGDGRNVLLGAKVKLNIPYYPDGKITEIEVSYDPEDGLGQYIRIRGTV